MQTQKPTKEMRDEAYRVSFFADEPLTQSILDDAQLLADYIQRNKSKLVKDGVLKEESKTGKKASRVDGVDSILGSDMGSVDTLPTGFDVTDFSD